MAKFLCWADVKLGKLILTLTAVPARGERVPKLRRLSGAGRKFERIYAPLFHICAAHFPGSIVVSSLFVSLGGVMTCTPFQRDLKSPPFLPPRISSWNPEPGFAWKNQRKTIDSIVETRSRCLPWHRWNKFVQVGVVLNRGEACLVSDTAQNGRWNFEASVRGNTLRFSCVVSPTIEIRLEYDGFGFVTRDSKILFIFFDVTLNDRTVCSLSKNKKGMLISYTSLHREEDYVSNIFTSDQISSLSCFNPMNVLLILLINSCRRTNDTLSPFPTFLLQVFL